jgi:hypothetical protein
VGSRRLSRNATPSGQRVGRIVQRVAEQRDRAGQRNHHRLRQRGGGQPGQRDPEGPQPFGRGFEHRVDRAVVIVGVRPRRVPQARPEPAVIMLVRAGVPVVVPLVMIVPVVPVVRAVVLVAAHLPSMTRKSRCSTSTSATRVRLRIPRSCGPADGGG